MAAKVLIFGANGQDGYYLDNLYRSKGIETVGVSRTGDWIHADVSCYDQVEQLIKSHRPTHVYHLAANTTKQHEAVFENHQTIATGTLNILEAVKQHCPSGKVFITGSASQFKNTGAPISENNPFEASSLYSVARIQSCYAARYYRSLGLRVYIGYLFSHESPLRKPNHLSQLIVQAVQRIALGSSEVIELGDISVKREWTFAGDVIKGIVTLVDQDEVFEAVIGSGTAWSIETWIRHCFSVINRNWRGHVKLREGFQPEYHCLVSNPDTINSLGWFPTVDLPELAVMMVNHNRITNQPD